MKAFETIHKGDEYDIVYLDFRVSPWETVSNVKAHGKGGKY